MKDFTLRLMSKSYAYIGDFTLPLGALPRVGEIIEASALLGDDYKKEVKTFFVYDITYFASSKGLLPRVSARQWYRGLRHEELQNRGWLPPQDCNFLIYDDEDLS